MTNFRALCAELLDEAIYLGQLPYEQDPGSELVDRARAALAQPTDEEILRIAAKTIEPYATSGITVGEYEAETECAVEVYGSELIAFARAVLDRWAQDQQNKETVND